MSLQGLLGLIQGSDSLKSITKKLGTGGKVELRVIASAHSALAAAVYLETCRPMLVLAATSARAREFSLDLEAWLGPTYVSYLPQGVVNPDTQGLSYDPVQWERLRVLNQLAASWLNHAPLVVTSLSTLGAGVMPKKTFDGSWLHLQTGREAEIFQLLATLDGLGYQRQGRVETPGSMSHRGDIVDIYPPTNELPIRLEFWGNTVEGIRVFDPETQCSLQKIDEAKIGPARELVTTHSGSLLDYLGPELIVVLEEAEELSGEKGQGVELGDTSLSSAGYPLLSLSSWGKTGNDVKLNFQGPPSYQGRLPELAGDLRGLVHEGKRVVVVTPSSSRLKEVLSEVDVVASEEPMLTSSPPPGSLTLVAESLGGGWVWEDTYLLTDSELFGLRKKPRQVKTRGVSHRELLPELSPGDYVVHVDHGIGRFRGTTLMRSTQGTQSEFMVLEYAAGSKLYVPVDQVGRVARYIGSGEDPALSHLGTNEWKRAKQRARKAARDIAQEMLSLYASREVLPGFAYSADTPWQKELESSFPYVETRDQLIAEEQIKADMERPHPMDRLLCGDVGYGKTELVLRAAFKAVMDGRQVAILVPTTVLAQQHYVTFTQRLAPFPVQVAMLSRLLSPQEQKKVLKGLAGGQIDICIGTHRLLQRDVSFKNLGLVVIDEEQRFGVSHKEHLKRLRREVDVLSVSATPIPRTLYMSLAGARDMSLMETPPQSRLPVSTLVAPFSDELVKEALTREMERGGQSFLVHNRVEGIDTVASYLSRLLPQARIGIAHGKMDEKELAHVMSIFASGGLDILVCTTIVESGLDIPSANTLIVNDADKLGLTQLYQLRGRVGRGADVAYAYFLYPQGKRLTPEARERLKTIAESARLGAGFAVAMKDLEIRGAGNILGTEQSGHVAAVGFSLYCELLSEAISQERARLSGRPAKDIKEPAAASQVALDLPLEAFIPDSYIPDASTRLSFYRRLGAVTDTREVDALAEEMKDRFGALAPQVVTLLWMVKLRLKARRAGIASIANESGDIVLRAMEGREFNRHHLEGINSVKEMRVGRRQIRILGAGYSDNLERVLEALVDMLAFDTTLA